MMSVNSYLTNLADKLIIRDSEKESIGNSFEVLGSRLKNYFGNQVGGISQFGSYQRNTILPRHYDNNSDVDIMIQFREAGYTPQRYLNKLKEFARKWYSSSEIYQDNPTVVLELNHIKFDLVPCISSDNILNPYLIPAPASNNEKWIHTSPFVFNEKLTEKNRRHNSHIKRLIRLMKLWNKWGSSVYSSFELERMIVDTGFWGCLLCGSNQLKDYFFEFVTSLNSYSLPYQYQREKVMKLVGKVQDIKMYETYSPEIAESKVKSIFE